ncbi:hypothetical protein OOJ91_34100 [Micromonospora lupini]|uniref:hypothetical protein n=1 Tax=Micromonospora lupini TaxID=285679 RepID=UPI00224D1C9F|nr:hypothetical protein [Micromonospora lupini]MCX5070882.1 hypothetical protein [Micromonospora lupini]
MPEQTNHIIPPVPQELVDPAFEAARAAVKAGGYTPGIADNHLLLVGVTAALGQLLYADAELRPLRCSNCGNPVSAPMLPAVVAAWVACPACVKADVDQPEELRKLRAQVAELQDEVPHLVRMGPGGAGHFEVVIKRGPRLIEAMGAALRDLLDEHAGENYVETDLAFGDGTHCKAIFVRPTGLSPHELRLQADRARNEAEARAAATRTMAIDANARLREKLLAALGLEDDGTTHLEAYIDQLVADRDRLAAQVGEATPDEDEEGHVLELRADGSRVLRHTADCEVLRECPVRAVVDREFGAGVLAGVVGRFPVELNDIGDRLWIGDRLPD